MFGMYLVPISIYKFQRHNNFIYETPMKNLLTFEPGYLVKFCNYYPYLSLQTVFSARKLKQIWRINMNIFFLETVNLITNLSRTPVHIPSLKYCPHNLRKYKGKQNSKIPIF